MTINAGSARFGRRFVMKRKAINIAPAAAPAHSRSSLQADFGRFRMGLGLLPSKTVWQQAIGSGGVNLSL
jgi:hypothetical protein